MHMTNQFTDHRHFRVWKWLTEDLPCDDRRFGLVWRGYLLSVSVLILYCAVLAFAGDIRTGSAFKHGEGFLTWEEGNPTYRSMRLLEGKSLYQDVACQYGPLPIYLRAGLAMLFGNNIYLDVGWHFCWSTAAIVLLFTFACRVMPLYAGLAATMFLVVPQVLATKGVSEYIGVERIILMLPLVLWKPLSERSLTRSALLALCCGMLQTVKFGAALFLGLSIFLIDIASLLMATKGSSRTSTPWTKHFLTMAVCVIVPELVVVGWTILTCDAAVAIDALWPKYVKDTYPMTLPMYVGWKHFLVRQLPILGNICVGVVVLVARWARGGSTDRYLFAGAIGFAFYCAAAPVYFGHVFMYYQYAFMLAPLAIVGASRMPRFLVPVLIVLNLTPFLLDHKIAWMNPRTADLVEEVLMPNGEHLLGRATFAADLRYLSQQVLPAVTPKSNLLLETGWAGGGFHAVYNRHYPFRNHFLVPVAFRNYDRLALDEKLAEIGWLLISDKRYENATLDFSAVDVEMPRVISPVLWRRLRARIPADGITRLNHFLVIRFAPEGGHER